MRLCGGQDRGASIQRRTDYRELRRRLLTAGVFEPRPGFYLLQVTLIQSMIAASVAGLFLMDSIWLLMLDAALLAFAFVQLGFVFHDAGHRQIFARARQNDIAMLLAGFVVGTSRSWWFYSHNSHHAHPNELDLDPDTELYVA